MVPIITHPERNAFLMKNLDVVQKFIGMGCLSQVTANAFTGFWGPKSKKAAEKLLQKKAIHIVATDAHDLASATSGTVRGATADCRVGGSRYGRDAGDAQSGGGGGGTERGG